MRSLNLDQLRTLVAIADLGTFAAAAQALNLAPPTISLHVSELEARLGVALLERGGPRAIPTAPGAALIERGRRLLHDADVAVEQMRRHAEGLAGTVRLGTSSGVLAHLLPPVLERLGESHPDLDVEIVVLGSADALARVGARTLDIGIVSLPQPNGDPVVTPWRSDPMMAFVPAGWNTPARITPQWLAARPLIANDNTTLMHRLVAGWFGQAGLRPKTRVELNYNEAMKSLVAAGYGAAILPLEGTASGRAVPDGVVVRPLQPALTRRLGLAHRPSASLDRSTRNVLSALRASTVRPSGERRARGPAKDRR